MINVELFLGLPLTAPLRAHLANADESLVQLFVGEGVEYLRLVQVNGIDYLGKSAGNLSDLSHLELLQTNIYSLLSKLLPIETFQKNSLELFPLVVE